MVEFGVIDVGEVFHSEETFGFGNAGFGKVDCFFLFLDFVIVLFERTGKLLCLNVHFAGLAASAGNNKRSTRFVYENTVHFVDNGEVKRTLNFVLGTRYHVVSQVVESKLVVCSVRNIAVVCLALCLIFHSGNGNAYGKTQKSVNFTHPFGVTLGKIVVDGDDVNALSFERVEIRGESSHQRFSFAGTHLGNTSLMQARSAHYLNVEVTHSQHAFARFSYHGKRFGQNVVKRFVIVFYSVAEHVGHAAQFVVGHIDEFLLVCVNLFDNGLQTLYAFAVVRFGKKRK